MANRIWHHHFGAGLVRTTSDFGVLGTPPTHPELLEYLARYFVDGGWSVKAVHRLILHSKGVSAGQSRHRRELREGSSESERMEIQSTSGWTRNRSATRSWPSAAISTSRGESGTRSPHRQTYFYRQHEPFSEFFPTSRRSVYIMQPRIQKHPYLDLFDGPDGNLPMSERKSTTTTLAGPVPDELRIHAPAGASHRRALECGQERPVRLPRAGRESGTTGGPPRPGELERARAYFSRATGSEEDKRAGAAARDAG